LAKQIVSVLSPCFALATDPDAESAVGWFVGEYGEIIEDSPYILERFLDSIKEGHESNIQLKLIVKPSVK